MVDWLKRTLFDRLSYIPGYSSVVKRTMTVSQRCGEISLEEAIFLGDLVREAPKDRPIIEIGTLFGTSTKALIIAKSPETRLITVDKYVWNPLSISNNDHFKITRELLKEAVEKHNVTLIRMDKAEFFATYAGPPPGLVFLDADHSYEETKKDIEWAQRAGAAIICGHDFGMEFPGVMQAVKECGGAKSVTGRIFVLKFGRMN